jgi:small subunit ribosomal protein S6
VTAQSAVVDELDRQLNLNESVLRTKITRTPEKIRVRRTRNNKK